MGPAWHGYARHAFSVHAYVNHAMHGNPPPFLSPSPLIFAGRGTEFLVKWFRVELSGDQEETVSVEPYGKCLESLRPADFAKASAKYDIIDPPPSWATCIPLSIAV